MQGAEQIDQKILRLLGPTCLIQTPNLKTKLEPYSLGEIEQLAFRSRLTRTLLVYLAVEQRPISREKLSALFWPDEELSKGKANLRRELHQLSTILPDSWMIDRQSASFTPCDMIVLDIDLINDFIAEGHLENAALLLQGQFLEGVELENNLEFESWLHNQREHWRDKAETVLERIIESHELKGDFHQSLRYCHQLLAVTPWDENIHQKIMRYLYWSGKREHALRQFSICAEILADELDIEPSEDTKKIYKLIRTKKLPPPPRRPLFLTNPDSARKERHTPFVGREEELAELEAAFSIATRGKAQFRFIAGNPGQGKTTLLEEFSRLADQRSPEVLIVSGSCNAFSGIGDPYLPFRDAMGMLTGNVESSWVSGAVTTSQATRLWKAAPSVLHHLLNYGRQVLETMVPKAHLIPRCQDAAQVGEEWAKGYLQFLEKSSQMDLEFEQSYLFQQFTNIILAVAKDYPLILILDDIHWADPGSIGLLFHLGRRLEKTHSRILVIGAYRPIELMVKTEDNPHPLVKGLNEFKRMYGDIWLYLGEEPNSQRENFVNLIIDTEPNYISEDFRSELFKRTNGHPLFTVDLLRHMQERGQIYQDQNKVWQESASFDWDILPSRIEAVLADRINRVPADLQEMLSAASVIGETFTSNILSRVLDLDEMETVQILSETLENKYQFLIEEERITKNYSRIFRYRFRHNLYQIYLYEQLSTGKKMLLHERVAMAMESVGSVDYSALAHHYKFANLEKKAIEYFIKSGQYALQIYANSEAETFFRSALAIIQEPKEQAYAIAGLSEAVSRQTYFDEAAKLCRQGIQLFLELGDLDQVARLYARLENIQYWGGDTPGSLEIIREGLRALEKAAESEGMAMFLNNAVRSFAFSNLLEEGRLISDRSLRMAKKLGSIAILNDALTSKCLLHVLSFENLQEVETILQDVIKNAEAHGLPGQAARAYNNISLVKNLSEALINYQKAQKLSRQAGTRHLEIFYGSNEVLMHLNLGKIDAASKKIEILTNLIESHNPSLKNKYVIDGKFRLSHRKGKLLWYQGYMEPAVQTLLPYYEKSKEIPEYQQALQCGIDLAHVYLELGKPQKARAIAEKTIGILGRISDFSPRLLLVLANIQENNLLQAGHWLDEAQQIFYQYLPDDFFSSFHFLHIKAQYKAAIMEWDQAWESFSSAIDQADRSGYKWHKTRIRLDWAVAQITRGGEFCSQGDLLLKKAQDEFEDMGAYGWVQRIKDQRKKLGL